MPPCVAQKHVAGDHRPFGMGSRHTSDLFDERPPPRQQAIERGPRVELDDPAAECDEFPYVRPFIILDQARVESLETSWRRLDRCRKLHSLPH